MRSVSLRLVDLQRCMIPIGYVGENEHTRVQIDAMKMFEEYPNATVSMTVQPPEGESYPAVVTRDGNIIIWDVTDSDLIAEGQGEIQVSFSVGDVVAKSFIGRIRIDRSIVPTGEIPEPIDDWLTRAGAALTELDNLSADAVTLDAGSQATAEITEVEGHKNIHIGVPKGADAPTDTYAPKANPVFTGSISMGRKSGTTVGSNSVATGSNVTASSSNSHAEGIDTQATGWAAHAEGAGTIASGNYSHTEGANSKTTAAYSHAEGSSTTASGTYSHAEGSGTTASGGYGSHAEGSGTTASGNGAHAEGGGTTASGYYSHAEGQATVASGILSHAEGEQTIANHKAQHVFGTFNTADNSGAGIDAKGNYVEIVGNGTANNARSNARTLDWSGNETLAGNLEIGGAFSRGRKNGTTVGVNSLAVGYNVEASAANTQALGSSTKASGANAHAEGNGTTASNYQAHAEGGGTEASGSNAHAEGGSTHATGANAHSEGSGSTASGSNAHAEGGGTTASGDNSHAEGGGSQATASQAHAEGGGTHATAAYAHAEGAGTTASGNSAHAENGGTVASGDFSHAEGTGTIANHKDQHVFGQNNIADPSEAASSAHGTYIEIVGNGTGANARSNARTLDWSGNEELAGDLKVFAGTNDEVSVSSLKNAITSLGNSKAPVIIDSASGAIATFPDGADGMPVESLIAEINPVQDLHGQSSPYPAGGGINLANPDTFETGKKLTNNGGTTNNQYCAVSDYIPVQPNTNYCARNCINSASGYAMCFYDSNKTFLRYQVVSGTSPVSLCKNSGNDAAYCRCTFILSSIEKSMLAQADSIIPFAPYSNICPITGWTGCNVTVANGDDPEDQNYESTIYPITWQTEAGTVYGGTVNPATGKLTVTDAEIASYNGETLPSTWISDRDVYAEGTTPTIGAQVVYKLAEPLEYDLTPTEIRTLLGYNAIFADTGDVVVDYRADTKLWIDGHSGSAITVDSALSSTSENPVQNKVIKTALDGKEPLHNTTTVSGTTQTITGVADTRYICGEVSTLSITAPASGCIDVTFTSGSTPTVLTVTPPTGMTMKWANGFDPTALEANTTYEINIMDGCLGVAGSWT